MSGKCIIVPREQELMAGCSWGHPTALLGWLSPGDSRKSGHTGELCAGGGREPNSGLYCTFRVSLLRRDMEHPPPLAQVGTERHPKPQAALPQGP